MSTTARKTRKRQRHTLLAGATYLENLPERSATDEDRETAAAARATAERLRFHKPAKRGTHYTDRFRFVWVVPSTGKQKGRLVPRSEAQKNRERRAHGDEPVSTHRTRTGSAVEYLR